MNIPLIKQNPWLVFSLLQSLGVYRLVQLYQKQKEQYKQLHSLTTYLVDMIEKNDITLTTFDIIVLQNLGVRVTAREES